MAQLVGAKGCVFSSRSGHAPRLQARSPLGCVQEANWCVSLSHSCFRPFPLSKINKRVLGEDKSVNDSVQRERKYFFCTLASALVRVELSQRWVLVYGFDLHSTVAGGASTSPRADWPFLYLPAPA